MSDGVRLVDRVEDGVARPVLVWVAGRGWRMVSTGVLGGGLGERRWWLNAKVTRDYREPDPAAHARRIASELQLPEGEGVGMLTAADVTRWTSGCAGGVHATVTVGLGLPVWAAADNARVRREAGTINVLVRVPAALSDAALVNAVVTVTEAKSQALIESGVPGTGTSSDAVCVACPVPTRGGMVHAYGGPRSEWGLRIARAVHEAVAAGVRDWLTCHPEGDEHRRWPHSRQ